MKNDKNNKITNVTLKFDNSRISTPESFIPLFIHEWLQFFKKRNPPFFLEVQSFKFP
jgi:hypothetical protein